MRPFLAVMLLCALLAGCGSSGSTSPPRMSINEPVSAYLSTIIDEPGAVRDAATGQLATDEIEQAATGRPRACLEAVRVVERIIERTDLGATAKRKRVLDAMVPVYSACPEPND